MQQYADIYLLTNYSTCFGRPSRPSSGVHKTLFAASGTGHTIWESSFFKRRQTGKSDLPIQKHQEKTVQNKCSHMMQQNM